ncbi:MAG: phosphate uptake regulator PhoU [Candidatus Methanolliviera hydrocarbonicum]|uniref:Phosphate uptake regulator PhoU n=1 Tax=Candidatus Methanolliviera hydrocarbonicum TaxID=2491085 RepID=A0A520KY00_9EURY|nr:MAG: phosphate uptake regulator PhoU [Candidatus Methanolliviera hydrocarbonicum]
MAKEVKRRVQVTGGSTHIISLPIEWVKKMGISRGDEVRLVFRADDTVLIGGKEGKEISKAVIGVSPEETIEEVYRSLIAHYLAGNDLIELSFKEEITKDNKKWMKNAVRKRLMGLEVVGESGTEMVFRSFINYEDFPLSEVLKSICDIVESMQGDAIAALRDGNMLLAEDVIQRDNEVDRFYLLAVRQLKAAIDSPDIGKRIGITQPKAALGYRIVVKSMERIGDHMKKVAGNVLQIGHKMDVPQIFDMYEAIKDIYSSSLEILSERDAKGANQKINDAEMVVKKSVKVKEGLLKGEFASGEMICLLSIVDSLVRVIEYIEDIVEICINMGANGV